MNYSKEPNNEIKGVSNGYGIITFVKKKSAKVASEYYQTTGA